jgi:hypothetical protein
MSKSINDVNLDEPKSKNERMWFGAIKSFVQETKFGKIELCLTVKNGVVVSISETKLKNNLNLSAN